MAGFSCLPSTARPVEQLWNLEDMTSADFLQELAYRHLTRTMNTLAGGLTLLGAPHPRNCTAFFLVQLGLPLEYLLFIVLF